MEIVLYHNHYEFHFWAGLKLAKLANFLNILPVSFQFQSSQDDIWYDSDRGPGVFFLQQKTRPAEEVPVSSTLANYYIKWVARSSEGDVPRLAAQLARELSREMETRVWLVDGYGRIVRLEGGDDYHPAEISA